MPQNRIRARWRPSGQPMTGALRSAGNRFSGELVCLLAQKGYHIPPAVIISRAMGFYGNYSHSIILLYSEASEIGSLWQQLKSRKPSLVSGIYWSCSNPAIVSSSWKVFFPLKNSFNEHHDLALQDYSEASLMLLYMLVYHCHFSLLVDHSLLVVYTQMPCLAWNYWNNARIIVKE